MQQKEIGSFLSLYYTLQRFMTDYSVLTDNQIRMQRKDNPEHILSTHAPSMIEGWQNRVKEVSQLIS